MKKATSESKQRPASAKNGEHTGYVLQLYVAGMTPRSLTAIHTIKRVCEKHLRGHYELQIVDLYRQPSQARESDIIVAPTLVKKLPLPLRRLIGNMADEEKVLVGLNVQHKVA